MEYASELRGFPVVSSDEGAVLGTLSTIYINAADRRVAALGYRTRWLRGEEFFVPISDVRKIGRDVVLIASETSAEKITNGVPEPPGRSLKDLQGVWVTTMDGRQLGTLVDVEFTEDWWISELSLAEDKAISVDAREIKIGDQIIVPAEYADRVRATRETEPGFLRRVFGGESRDDTKRALRRALRRREPAHRREENGDKVETSPSPPAHPTP